MNNSNKEIEYSNILNEFFNLNRFHIKLGLERIIKALKLLNNPQNSFKSIHIAGTNGKGSTCHIITTILKNSNYKIGMYTSPFLTDFKESITINNNKISVEEVVRYYNQIKKIDKEYNLELTYFEVKTIMAFLHFSENKIDFAVIEVGMGGRDDATNVITPIITAITNVDMDHTNILGETIDEIATIKAGIIKPNIPFITHPYNKGLKIITKTALINNSKLILTNNNESINYKTNLIGNFQKNNINLALNIIAELNKNNNINISQEIIKKSLLEIPIKGRMEKKIIIDKEKNEYNVLFDCAHNLPAIKVLKEEISNIRPQYNKIITIFTALKDKMQKDMINEIKTISDQLILTTLDIHRASDINDLVVHMDNNTILSNTPSEALNKAKELYENNNLILICGSCYLVGEIKKTLE